MDLGLPSSPHKLPFVPVGPDICSFWLSLDRPEARCCQHSGGINYTHKNGQRPFMIPTKNVIDKIEHTGELFRCFKLLLSTEVSITTRLIVLGEGIEGNLDVGKRCAVPKTGMLLH